jgi:hypothetical protein
MKTYPNKKTKKNHIMTMLKKVCIRELSAVKIGKNIDYRMTEIDIPDTTNSESATITVTLFNI